MAESQSGGRRMANGSVFTVLCLQCRRFAALRSLSNPNCGLSPAAIGDHRCAIQIDFGIDHQLTTAPSDLCQMLLIGNAALDLE